MPSAFVAGLLASIIWLTLRNILNPLTDLDPDSILNVIFAHFMDGTITGLATVMAGTYVAPRAKPVVSSILAGLFLIQWGFLIPLFLQSRGHWAWLGIVGGAIAAIAVPVAYWKQEIEKRGSNNEGVSRASAR